MPYGMHGQGAWGREQRMDKAMNVDLSGGLPVEREYFLAECPVEAEIRDAVNVWLEDEDARFGMRIGVEAVSSSWETPDIYLDIAFPDGRAISLRRRAEALDPFDDAGRPAIRGAGPLSFRCVEPFRRWRVEFDGSAPEVSAAELIETPYPDESVVRRVRFAIDLTMAVPPWVPGALVPDAARVLTESDQGDFVSPRYEQLFRAEGELWIDDLRTPFRGQGLRIRRQGFRQFEGFWGHCWQSCLFSSGKAFGFNVFPPREDGQPSYAEGFVFDGKGGLVPAVPVVVPWLSRLGVEGDEVPFELEAVGGRIHVWGRSFINLRGRYSTVLPPDFPPDFPIIQQSHVRYVWDGEAATGMMERSTPPSRLHR